jgi:Fe-S-cluster containining protein
MLKHPEHQTAHVPCDGCTACCKHDDVYLHPECGDDPGAFQTEARSDGRKVLAHAPTGECIYLGADGCRIWSHRPCACRVFSCVTLVSTLTALQRQTAVQQGLVSQAVVDRGLLLLKAKAWHST